MSISALVLTLAEDSISGAAALARLHGDRRFELGEPAGPRLPVVLEARDRDEERHVLEELRGDPGVVDVQVVFVEVSESLDRERSR